MLITSTTRGSGDTEVVREYLPGRLGAFILIEAIFPFKLNETSSLFHLPFTFVSLVLNEIVKGVPEATRTN